MVINNPMMRFLALLLPLKNDHKKDGMSLLKMLIFPVWGDKGKEVFFNKERNRRSERKNFCNIYITQYERFFPRQLIRKKFYKKFLKCLLISQVLLSENW